jgi:hypothetical protein
MLQLVAPQFQGVAGVLSGRRERFQRTIRKGPQMQVVVIFRSAGVEEPPSARIRVRIGPCVAFVFVALAAAPVEIVVVGNQVGTGILSVDRTVMVYTAARFAAEKVLVPETVGAAIPESRRSRGRYSV